MPRKATHEVIAGSHFRWILIPRHGTWYADGRGNTPNPGRHSLGTKIRTEAVQRLAQLDRVKAVEFGLADAKILDENTQPVLGLKEGWSLYKEHLARPEVAGGASLKTRQRYAAIFDKFIPFAEKHGARDWNHVTDRLLSSYLAHLEKERYAARTLYAEGIVLKQIVRWLVNEKLIPHERLLKLSLKKVRGSDAYCYTPEQVEALIVHCHQRPKLRWLGEVILTLSRTGLRIAELAALRWTDIDFDRNIIRIGNDRGLRAQREDPRRTKNRRDRVFPLNNELRTVFGGISHRNDSRVFHGPRGGRLKPDTVRTIFIADVIQPLKVRFPTPAGEIGFEHGRLHTFRHYFCSRAADQGVPLQMLMTWLGHSSSEIVRLYYHQLDSEAQRQMKRIDFKGTASGDVAVGPAPEFLEAPQTGQSKREAS
jgi:integrase